MGVEKRLREMRYLLGSSPRKRDHYRKRGLRAVERKSAGGRLTPGALAGGSLLGEHGNQAPWALLVTEEAVFKGALRRPTVGLGSQLLTLFG